MIAGQVLDIGATNNPTSLEFLNFVHRLKTGALIATAVEFGGIIAHASEAELKTLNQFAYEIGLAFQIIDDILDVTASEKKHGRAIASDVMNGKTTYVTLLGIEPSQERAEQLFKCALDRLTSLPLKTDRLAEIADRLVHRTI